MTRRIANLWLHFADGRTERRENVDFEPDETGEFDLDSRRWRTSYTIVDRDRAGRHPLAWIVCLERCPRPDARLHGLDTSRAD